MADGARRKEDEEIERYSEKDAETVLNRFGILILWAAVGVAAFVVAGWFRRVDLLGYIYIGWGALRALLPDYWPLGTTGRPSLSQRVPFPSGSTLIVLGLVIVVLDRFPGRTMSLVVFGTLIVWMFLRPIIIVRRRRRQNTT